MNNNIQDSMLDNPDEFQSDEKNNHQYSNNEYIAQPLETKDFSSQNNQFFNRNPVVKTTEAVNFPKLSLNLFNKSDIKYNIKKCQEEEVQLSKFIKIATLALQVEYTMVRGQLLRNTKISHSKVNHMNFSKFHREGRQPFQAVKIRKGRSRSQSRFLSRKST